MRCLYDSGVSQIVSSSTAGIKPNSGHRDYSRLSCGGGKTQLGALFESKIWSAHQLTKESVFSATSIVAVIGVSMIAQAWRGLCAISAGVAELPPDSASL